MTKEYCKAWEIEVGDIVEMDYQKNVAYVKGFSKERAGDRKRLVYIHPEWESQLHWLAVARQRLRLVEKRSKQ